MTGSRVGNSIQRHRETLDRIADRKESTIRRAEAILHSVPENERNGVTAEAWLSKVHSRYGESFKNAIDRDSDTFEDMSWASRCIEQMLFAGGPDIDLLLEFPIADERDRKREAKRKIAEETTRRKIEAEEHARVEKQEAELKARVARVEHLRGRADDGLGSDAADWLDSLIKPENVNPMVLAESSQAEFERACSILQTLISLRREQAKIQNVIDGFRWRLASEANRVFGEQKGELFVRSKYRILGGKSPMDYCVNGETLARCLALLKESRER